jgi:metal-responsive CopG/Arc/MetJ family transcriptional regulator
MKHRGNALKATTERKPTRRADPSRGGNERVLIEFPSQLLDRAEQAARDLQTNRSELIRNAVEQFLNDMQAKEFERQLAAAYAANADMNRALAAEFAAADPEGF